MHWEVCATETSIRRPYEYDQETVRRVQQRDCLVPKPWKGGFGLPRRKFLATMSPELQGKANKPHRDPFCDSGNADGTRRLCLLNPPPVRAGVKSYMMRTSTQYSSDNPVT